MRWIRRSIQAKMFFSFLIVLIVPSVIISVCAYYQSVHILKDKLSRSFMDNILYISSDLERNFSQMIEISEFIYINKDIKKVLTTSYVSELDFFKDARIVDRQLDEFNLYSSFFSYISSIILFGDNGKNLLYGKHVGALDISPMRDEAWFRQAAANDHVQWLPLNTAKSSYLVNEDFKTVALARSIKSENFKKNIGVAYISFDYRFFDEMFEDQHGSMGNREIFIIDNHGALVYHVGGDGPLTETDQTLLARSDSEPYTMRTEEGREYLVASRVIPKYGWRVMETSPVDELVRDSKSIFTITGIAFVLSFLFSALLWFFISSSIVKPIKKLTQVMKQVKGNNLLVKTEITTPDEVGLLSANFNYMIDRIYGLFQSVLREQEQKQSAQLAALQSQINPHFLYNTLNTIRWMAIIQNADNIKKMVEALGNLFKNAVYHPNALISVKQELSNLEDYLYIQKIRYKDKFEVVYDVDASALDCATMKFILQPLVENAIFHGIEPKEGRGVLRIEVKARKDQLIMVVEDDGIGIPKETLESLLLVKAQETRRTSGRPNGIGVSNVNERLIMMYGHLYGLHVVSELGNGTRVEARFPKMTLDDDEQGG
ncbi:hypothetical protein SY83_05315 [Paenibacillus swuensis]|uniref:histidine kinase n=1 Tax=Paenibacillus swuensis TaxID=1178515 RepID=A0A172TGA1_9BACL|nr:sensor histidine kinase [Paenibacillus swuensis]ANE45813.1 hypothetical protein SY83_05315 [Paenibacillus swuensis]